MSPADRSFDLDGTCVRVQLRARARHVGATRRRGTMKVAREYYTKVRTITRFLMTKVGVIRGWYDYPFFFLSPCTHCANIIEEGCVAWIASRFEMEAYFRNDGTRQGRIKKICWCFLRQNFWFQHQNFCFWWAGRCDHDFIVSICVPNRFCLRSGKGIQSNEPSIERILAAMMAVAILCQKSLVRALPLGKWKKHWGNWRNIWSGEISDI